MKFDPLRYEHLKQMAQIEQEAFDQPWSERMFIPEVEDENAYYLVGVRGDEVVCYGGFHKVLDEAHITANKNSVPNDPEKPFVTSGKGIGTLLMSELISRARLLGIKAMTLEVKDINLPAIALYKSFGFTVEGVRPRYYNNLHDALIMWLSL